MSLESFAQVKEKQFDHLLLISPLSTVLMEGLMLLIKVIMIITCLFSHSLRRLLYEDIARH